MSTGSYLLTHKRTNQRTHNERGVATIWLIVFASVFLGVTALVTDILRQQVVLRQAQNAADAASLAAARMFDGSVQGWARAKRAAVEVLRQQQVLGVSDSRFTDLNFDDGIIDPFESAVVGGDSYKGTHAEAGRLEVDIDRGAFWNDGFHSLEGKPLGDVGKAVTYEGNSFNQLPMDYQVPVHLMANAVQVKVRVNNLQTYFARVFGADEFGTLSRTSVSLSDNKIEQEVFPFAVPACALLLDTQSSIAENNYQYDTTEFEPAQQCVRDLVFTEDDPKGPGINGGSEEFRADGLIRSEVYAKRVNERALPLYGVIGLPMNGAPTSPVDPNQLLNSFDSLRTAPLYAQLGQYFQPLHDAASPAGLYNIGADRLSQTLVDLINGGEFLAGRNPGELQRHGLFLDEHQQPLASLPYLRKDPQRLGVPGDQKLNYGPEAVLYFQLASPTAAEPYPYVNPLCSSPELRNIPMDSRKGRKVRAMVVAPESPGVNFCDYRAVFAGAEQNTSPVTFSTASRVVGFVNLYIYDFRITKFGATDLPYLNDPANRQPVRLLPQGNQRQFEIQKNFVMENIEWSTCMQRPRCPPGCPDPMRWDCPFNCRDRSCGSRPEAPPLPPGQDWAQWQQCFKLPDRVTLMNCLNPPPPDELERYNNWLSICRPLFQGNTALGVPETWGEPRGDYLTRGEACFPLKRPGCWPAPGQNPNDVDCWDPPEPLEPQFGCGGIRGRIECGKTRMTSPTNVEVQGPMLIQ